MADQLKEIYNGTLTFGDYVAGQQVVVATDANTQYVIKDVQVENKGHSPAPTLIVNGMPVASLSGSLSGAEIVDVNSEIRVAATDNLPFFSAGVFHSASSEYLPSFSGSSEPLPGFSPVANGFVNAGGVTVLNGSPKAWWIANGDFYYLNWDSNSVSTFYKRQGGPNGAQSTIHNINYTPVCFDGVSKFYWVDGGGYMKSIDALTGVTSTSVSSCGYAGTTYPTITYCEGLVFFTHSTAQAVRVFRISDESWTVLGNVPSYSSAVMTMPFYDKSTKTLRIVYGTWSYTTSFFYVDISLSSPLTFVKSGTISTTEMRFSHGQGSLGAHNIAMSNALPDTLLAVDRDLKIVARKKFAGLSINTSSMLHLAAATPTTGMLNAFGPSLKLRITGIKSTI